MSRRQIHSPATARPGRPPQQSRPRPRVNTAAARRATGGGEGARRALLAERNRQHPGRAADRRGTRPRRRGRHPDDGAVLPPVAVVPPSASLRACGGAWFSRLARPCPPTVTPDELIVREGMGWVTPWSPHDGARHAQSRAGPGRTRLAAREDPERRCTHQRATHHQSARAVLRGLPWMRRTPAPGKQKQH